MTNKVKKIGMIGAGWVSEHHLNAYQKLQDQAQVVAIVDPSAAARNTRVEQYGIERAYADAGEMLEQETLDVVDITSPRQFHAEHVMLAADQNLPVMCQKPLASNFTEAKDLVSRVSGKIPIMVHENWRWRPHYRKIKHWIDQGHMGQPLQVAMTLFTSGLLPDIKGELPAIVRQPMIKGLERMLVMEVMIHHVDCLRFLLGDLELESSRIGKVCDDIIGEDNATLYLRTHSGGSVVLAGNFCAHGYPCDQTDNLEMIGECGSIRLYGNRLELKGLKNETLIIDLAANYKLSYQNAIEHFLDCLDGEKKFETGPADNLRTLDIVEEVYKAHTELIER
jgi:predicted dehydrogenase